MKLYFAGPLFTTPERTWNVEVVAALRAAGHEIFLPQEQEPGNDAAGIFATDSAASTGRTGSSPSWTARIPIRGRAGRWAMHTVVGSRSCWSGPTPVTWLARPGHTTR